MIPWPHSSVQVRDVISRRAVYRLGTARRRSASASCRCSSPSTGNIQSVSFLDRGDSILMGAYPCLLLLVSALHEEEKRGTCQLATTSRRESDDFTRYRSFSCTCEKKHRNTVCMSEPTSRRHPSVEKKCTSHRARCRNRVCS